MRVLFLLLLVAATHALADVEPGNWELSATTLMQGLDQPMGPVVQTRCLSAEDARDPSRVLGSGGGCEFSNRSDSGSLFTFDVSCGGLLPMRGTGSVRYSGQAFEADLDLGADAGGGQKIGLRSRVTGRRLGPC